MIEAPLQKASLLVESIHDDLRRELPGKYAIFGHSMGALLAALWAQRIEDDGLPPPIAVFLSSRGVPTGKPTLPHSATMNDQNLLVALDARFGGNSASTLTDPSLREIYLPLLRADLAVVDSVEPSLFSRPLNTDLHILRGSNDPSTTAAAVEAWRSYTSAGFQHEVLPGGHFFHFNESEEQVLSILKERLATQST